MLERSTSSSSDTCSTSVMRPICAFSLDFEFERFRYSHVGIRLFFWKTFSCLFLLLILNTQTLCVQVCCKENILVFFGFFATIFVLCRVPFPFPHYLNFWVMNTISSSSKFRIVWCILICLEDLQRFCPLGFMGSFKGEVLALGSFIIFLENLLMNECLLVLPVTWLQDLGSSKSKFFYSPFCWESPQKFVIYVILTYDCSQESLDV